MLPDVDRQQGNVPAAHWILGVGSVHNEELLVFFGEPGPARPKVADCLGNEVFEEVVEVEPFGLDLFEELSIGLGLVGGDAVPEEGVVPMLKGVVEYFLVIAPESLISYCLMIYSKVFCSHRLPLMRLFRVVT